MNVYVYMKKTSDLLRKKEFDNYRLRKLNIGQLMLTYCKNNINMTRLFPNITYNVELCRLVFVDYIHDPCYTLYSR